MAQPYQLVYRLEDFRTDERYITSDVNGSKLNIYEDIVSQLKRGNFSKLGIQAPPGVIFYINASTSSTSKEPIRMGRTGIYELDEDVNVSSLFFEELPNYVRDEEETAKRLQEGLNQLQAAKAFYDNEMKYIADKEKFPDNLDDKGNFTASYWADYAKVYNGGTLSNGESIDTGYSTMMEGAYSAIIQGLNGIYKVDGTKEIDNVIIDFLIEEGGTN